MTAQHALASPPRSGKNFTVTFGLVNVPVKVYSGADRGPVVERKMFTTDDHPVGYANVDKDTGSLYSGEVVKKALASNGSFVTLTDEELDAAAGGAAVSGVLAVETFVPLDAIGTTYVVEKVDQVRPADRKVGSKRQPDPAAVKGFGLLMEAMKAKGVAALVRLPRRGIDSFGAILPDGRFAWLLFADQVRADLPMPEPTHTEAEAALGLQLIEAVGIDTPVLRDESAPKVQAFIDAKAGGETPVVEEPAAVEPVIDLAAALAASVAAKAAATGGEAKAKRTRKAA